MVPVTIGICGGRYKRCSVKEEAQRHMARNQIARTPKNEMRIHSGARVRGMRARLLVALPLALLLALAVTGTALATGIPPSKTPTVTFTPGSGPVGIHITFNGADFKPGDNITIGYSSGPCGTGVTTIAGASGTADSTGNISIPFVWPPTDKGDYYICAVDSTNGQTYTSKTPFQVLSKDPATITMPDSVETQAQVTVKGENFLPAGGTVEVRYGAKGSNGCDTVVGTATVNQDGTFTVTFNAPFTDKDETITVTAVEPQGSCAGGFTLQAQHDLVVKAKAQVVVSPTPAPTATPSAGFPFLPSNPVMAVVYCLVGLLLLLLLLLLVLLLVRRRRKDEPVAIEERDHVVVNSRGASGAGAAGNVQVQRQIVARDAKGNVTPVAEEVYTDSEDLVDDSGRQP